MLENILLLKNCFELKGRLKILNYSSSSESGVIIKSSELNSKISINTELELNDCLIFEPIETGAIPGEYFLQFDIIAEDEAINTKYFGNASSSDFEILHILSSENFKIIYIVQCNEKCATCDQLGSYPHYHCIQCNNNYPFKINDGQICQNFCTNFIRKDEQGVLVCIDSCDENEYIYIKSENETYCLSSCSYEGLELYQDEIELICYKSCSEANNGNNKLYENKCMAECPENYISNENNICIQEIKSSQLSMTDSISNDAKVDINYISDTLNNFINNSDMGLYSNILEINDSTILNNGCFLSLNENQVEKNNMSFHYFVNDTGKLFQNCYIFLNSLR